MDKSYLQVSPSRSPLSKVRYWNLSRGDVTFPLSVNPLIIPYITKYSAQLCIYGHVDTANIFSGQTKRRIGLDAVLIHDNCKN